MDCLFSKTLFRPACLILVMVSWYSASISTKLSVMMLCVCYREGSIWDLLIVLLLLAVSGLVAVSLG